MAKEIWKDIPNYEGLYQASSKGRIKSLKRTITFGWNNSKKIIGNRILKDVNLKGYRRLKLGNGKTFPVHRLIAIAFLPNPENKSEVNHINGIKHDNRVENLEWVTHLANVRHAYTNGLIKNACRGERVKQHILNSDDVLLIRFIGASIQQRTIANLFDVNQSTIERIINRKTWKHL